VGDKGAEVLVVKEDDNEGEGTPMEMFVIGDDDDELHDQYAGSGVGVNAGKVDDNDGDEATPMVSALAQRNESGKEDDEEERT
jgi:hypothetical protein